jgi:hypothetical protein
MPGGRIGENRAEGEDVAPAVGLLAADLFGRHERNGADNHPGGRNGSCVHWAGNAEVDNPRPVLREDDVAGLQVPVDQTACVHGGQSLRQRSTQPADSPGFERATLLNGLAQGRPRDVGSDHPRRISGGVGVNDGCRVETADLPRRRDLAGEPLPEFSVGRIRREDQLDRHFPAARRFSQEHLPHAAGT